MEEKYRALTEFIGQFDQVGVCVSGGSDSCLVAIAAVDALGSDRVVAITANTAFFTGEELEISKHLCDVMKIRHVLPQVMLLSDEDVMKNTEERCYFCKRNMLKAIREAAEERKLSVLLDGSNASDRHQYMPGERAMKKYDIISPLKEVGIVKEDIPVLLKQRGMKEFIRPENACIATRIATGEPITIKKLRWIRAAENYLRQLGFDLVRVRVKDGNARIEVAPSKVADLLAMQDEVLEEIRGMGYREVEIDPDGYRSKGGYCLGE